MPTTIALDSSPTTIVRRLHGLIVSMRTAYPEILHIEVDDRAKGRWRLASWDADLSTVVPETLKGRSIERAEIDGGTGELRLVLAGDSTFSISPDKHSSPGDPPSWELITPDGLALVFGPGLRWQIARADAPLTSRT